MTETVMCIVGVAFFILPVVSAQGAEKSAGLAIDVKSF